MATFLISLWGSQGTTIHVADGAASWSIIVLLDGLSQGHNLSTILFCLGLRRALRRFMESLHAAGLGTDACHILHLEFIDDLLMKLPPDSVNVWLPLLRAALASANLSLKMYRRVKFSFHLLHRMLHMQA